MAKTTYRYFKLEIDTLIEYDTNYDLLASEGIILEPQHDECNAYTALGRWKNYVAGEWTEGARLNGKLVFRIKKTKSRL